MKRRAFAGAALGLAGGMVVSGRTGVSGWMTEAVAQESGVQAEALPGAGQQTAGQLAGGALVRKPLVLGMVLEPPALDPTAGAAAAIAEVVLYNVFETLVHVGPKGALTPLLAERWSGSEDGLTWTFHLRPGVKFQNGKPCDAAAVKFSFERAGRADSVNKDRAFFAAMSSVDVKDAQTVVIRLARPDAEFLFMLGQATAVIVEPSSAAGNGAQPVGTGPYRLGSWRRGTSLTLQAWPEFRDAASVSFPQVTFRFISEPAAQMAALMANEVDVFPRVTERAVARLKQLGHGTPIGSHYTPDAPGYVDMTAVNAHDPERARALLKEAGVKLPLSLSLTVPPPPYARQAAQVVMAQLAKVGIQCRVQQVEWAQWLEGTYRNHDYDLSIISHVEPLDLGNFTKPDYYWGYRSPRFDALYRQLVTAVNEKERLDLLAQVQKLLAEDCVLAWLYQPHWVSVARKSLAGLWDDMPMLVNDLRSMRWVS